MQLTPAIDRLIEDALEDLKDALSRFKVAPNVEVLDDVYRATTAIEAVCRKQVEK